MDPGSDNSPLIVILGPTASGKTQLAMQLAQQFDGEIIAADSRTVYRGMDIGTAKPSSADQVLVPHHLLDIADPSEVVTAAIFKQKALTAIEDIAGRGKLPMMVGGSGLYVDAVLFNFSFLPPANTSERDLLQKLSVEELQKLALSRGLPLPQNSQNPRHLIRAIETMGLRPQRAASRPNTLVLGMYASREKLEANIRQRIGQMFADGLLDETASLAQQYGWDAPALQTTSYRAVRDYLSGAISLKDAEERFLYNDLHLAKRQLTWFRRNPGIKWICSEEEAVEQVTTFLNK